MVLVLIMAIHVIWWFLTSVANVRSIFLPSISDTYGALIGFSHSLDFWTDLSASWLRVTVAFLAALSVSYPLVLLSTISEKVQIVVFSFAEFFRYLPVPVFVPLTILWFGVEDVGKVVVIFLGTFAQMIPMFYDSVRMVKNNYPIISAALKWSSGREIRKIVMPGSAPLVFDNCRICLGWAWTYLIVAELIGANHGIGYAIIRAQRYLATDKIFAYVIVIGLMGVFTDRLMRIIHKRIFSWKTNAKN